MRLRIIIKFNFTQPIVLLKYYLSCTAIQLSLRIKERIKRLINYKVEIIFDFKITTINH
jgi:hypothetical protein